MKWKAWEMEKKGWKGSKVEGVREGEEGVEERVEEGVEGE